jgi:hypothetical protein
VGECYQGTYKDNSVVLHYPLVCFGGFGQPACEYVDKCKIEYNVSAPQIKKINPVIKYRSNPYENN